MRTERHNGRKNKNGNAYSPKHNDRNFDPAKTNVKHPEKTWMNIYFNCFELEAYQDKDKAGHMTFEEVETRFYEKTFSEGAKIKQAEDIKQRHPERQAKHTPEFWRKSTRTCPEDTVYQVGCPKDGETIEGKALWHLVMDQLMWEKKTFPQVKVVDVAMHRDENTDHFHVRKVYLKKEDGYNLPNEAACLRQMGFKDRYIDKRGNEWKTFDAKGKPTGATEETGKPYKVSAKAQYTAKCREHWEEMVKQKSEELGLHFTPERLEKGKTGRDMDEVRTERAHEELVKAQAEVVNEKKKAEKQKKVDEEAEKARKLKEAEQQAENERLTQENARLAKQNADLSEQNADLSTQVEDLSTQVKDLSTQVEEKETQLTKLKSQFKKLKEHIQGLLKPFWEFFNWEKSVGLNHDDMDIKAVSSLEEMASVIDEALPDADKLGGILSQKKHYESEKYIGEEEERNLW